MFDESDADTGLHVVVCNHEEQYSIWPADRSLPAGWRVAGPTGPVAGCLAYIDETWTDMRPLSLRRAMDAAPPVAGTQPG